MVAGIVIMNDSSLRVCDSTPVIATETAACNEHYTLDNWEMCFRSKDVTWHKSSGKSEEKKITSTKTVRARVFAINSMIHRDTLKIRDATYTLG